MKAAFLSFLFIFTFFFGFCQTKHPMVVCDAVTGKAIPYATVKVLNKEDGTYADETGKFEVKASDIDSLLITCVGYQSKIVNTQRDTIHLEPIVVHLREVKVTPIKMKEQLVGLGKSKKVQVLSFCGYVNVENVLKINIPESYSSYRIKGVMFNFQNLNGIAPVRLHIYNQNKDGLPDMEILPEDVIINKHLKINGEIDLTRFNLILDEKVLFVGVESIIAHVKYNPHKGECIGFGFTLDEQQPITYYRSLLDPTYRWRLDKNKWLSVSRNKTKNPGNLMVSLILD